MLVLNDIDINMRPSRRENTNNVMSPNKVQFNRIIPTQNTVAAPGNNEEIYLKTIVLCPW